HFAKERIIEIDWRFGGFGNKVYRSRCRQLGRANSGGAITRQARVQFPDCLGPILWVLSEAGCDDFLPGRRYRRHARDAKFEPPLPDGRRDLGMYLLPVNYA